MLHDLLCKLSGFSKKCWFDIKMRTYYRSPMNERKFVFNQQYGVCTLIELKSDRFKAIRIRGTRDISGFEPVRINLVNCTCVVLLNNRIRRLWTFRKLPLSLCLRQVVGKAAPRISFESISNHSLQRLKCTLCSPRVGKFKDTDVRSKINWSE